jgi:hypothetical protein
MEATWWGWGPNRAEWTPLGAVATLQACEQEQARHTKLNDALAKVVAKSPYVAWRCLPDTVDPRGPKGQRARMTRPFSDWCLQVESALHRTSPPRCELERILAHGKRRFCRKESAHEDVHIYLRGRDWKQK